MSQSFFVPDSHNDAGLHARRDDQGKPEWALVSHGSNHSPTIKSNYLWMEGSIHTKGKMNSFSFCQSFLPSSRQLLVYLSTIATTTGIRMDLASILLALLTLHRTGTSIALHEAKSRTHFSTALAVLLGEVLKQIISFTIAAYTTVGKEDQYQSLPTTSSPELEKDAQLSSWNGCVAARCEGQKHGWQALMS